MKIISQETIKPSSPTPSHLKRHVISSVDRYFHHGPVPFVFFYKNFNDDEINNLKKSLSLCLTQYYPFAGRLSTPNAGHIDCNDEGVEFLEASHDIQLDNFILKKENDERLYQLLPDFDKNRSNLMHVQLNHFNGGGVALLVSISHRVADAFTSITFIDQWAKVTRGGSPFKPNFFTSSTSEVTSHEVTTHESSTQEMIYVTTNFVFPNSKLNELKKKVMRSMGMGATSPSLTRVEVLTSLLFKCAVDAATSRSGFFKPSVLFHPINMRNKISENNPDKAAGNILSPVVIMIDDSSEMMLNEVAAKLKKGKMECKERDVQEIGEKFAAILPMLVGDPILPLYPISSFCWFPFYEVDFGWGKPVQAKYVIPNVQWKYLCLMDTLERDGIEASVRLPIEEMVIFQEDKELLACLY